jgi:hypothetical protein
MSRYGTGGEDIMSDDSQPVPEGKWLWNQPKIWHEVNRALQDIAVLLEYIGKLPDARLLSYFDDTRSQIADGAIKNALPPVGCYPAFLSCLSDIAAAFESGDKNLLPHIPARSDQCAPLTAIGFVYWSRDFLASVAAPATADSIRLTQHFLILRARWSQLFRRNRSNYSKRTNRPGADGSRVPPIVLPDPEEPARKLIARRLASVTYRYDIITIVMVAFTVLISVYALTGRLIMSNLRETQDNWQKLDAAMELYEDKIFPPAKLPVNDKDDIELAVIHLCEFVRDPPSPSKDQSKVVAIPSSNENMAITQVTLANDTVDDTPTAPKQPRHYVSAHQAHLCEQREKALLDLFVVTMHLQSWSSVATLRYQDYSLGPLFGIRPAALREYAQERAGRVCEGLSALGSVKDKDRVIECERTLWTYILRSRNIADSILGSITEFILPMCYGFLGSMAAVFRLIRRKVDASMLVSTDRVRLSQGAILGVLCGGVVGLFAGYIGKGDVASGLGLSAVALLAGYNIDGVFRLLDELSERMFHPNSNGK